METKENLEFGRQKRSRKIVLKLILALLAILILLVGIFVPAFVSSEKGKETILARINKSVAGRTDFATLSMSWFRGIKITDVRFNDQLGRISVAVKQIATKPHYSSILTGSLSFGQTVIDEPKVEVNLNAQQAKASEGTAQQAKVPERTVHQQASVGRESQPIVLPIKRIDLVVNNGDLKVADRRFGAAELSQINSKVNLRPPGQQTKFDVNMTVVGEGNQSKISAAGQIAPPRKGWSLKGTSGDFAVEVNDLDLASLGSVFALAGVEIQAKGSVSANVKSEIKDGQLGSSSGTIKARDLDIGGPVLKGDRLKTSRLDVDMKLQRQKDTINIDSLQVNTDWLSATASGVVPTTSKSLAEFLEPDSAYSLKGNFECDLGTVLSQMPNMFGLKEGTKVTSGQLNGSIETVTQAGQKAVRGQANLAGLSGVVGGKTVTLSEPVKAEAQITSDKGSVRFDRLDVSSAFCTVSCTGTTELLKYNADIDLGKLQSELGQFIDIGQYQMAGQITGNGQVSSGKDKIVAAGSSVVKNLRITSREGVSAFEPEANISFSVTAEPKKEVLNVEFITASAGFGQVGVKDTVLPLGKQAKVPINLYASANVDLAKLQSFAVLFASLPKDMQLAGMAESQISVSSKKDSYRIMTDKTKIKNLKVNYPGQVPFEQGEVSVVFDAEINPVEKTVVVRKLQLVSPQVKIEGNLSQTAKAGQTMLTGRADYEYDWSALSTVAGPFLPTGLKIEGRRKDSIDFSSQYPSGQTDRLLANLNTKAKLGFERAEYMGLVFGPTEVLAQVQGGVLRIAPFSTTVNQGQLNFAGEADFNRKPTLLQTPGPIQMIKDIQITDETTKKLLMYVNPVFANTVNASGLANFSCEKFAIPLGGASKNAAEVIGTFSLTNLRLQVSDLLGQILQVMGTGFTGQEITIHPTRFVLQNGFLQYDDMQMDVGDKPINFKGVIGLDKSLNMTVTLPYTIGGRMPGTDQETSGSRVSLPLRGTVDKPQLDVGRLLEGQLKQQLEDQLRKGLEKILIK